MKADFRKREERRRIKGKGRGVKTRGKSSSSVASRGEGGEAVLLLNYTRIQSHTARGKGKKRADVFLERGGSVAGSSMNKKKGGTSMPPQREALGNRFTSSI